MADPQPPLADVALGDVIAVPDGRHLTVRSRVDLPVPVGPMAGFLVCGELALLISLPPDRSVGVGIYEPVGYLPDDIAAGHIAAEGAARYWAPHLPGVSGAMADLLWRVVTARGRFEPAVVAYRGPDFTVFIHHGTHPADDLPVQYLPRNRNTERDWARHSGVVVPKPAGQPAPAPRRVPEPAQRSRGGGPPAP